MKILIVSSVQTHPTTSGSGSFIKKYTTLLQRMGHEVYFLHVQYYSFSKSTRIASSNGVKATKDYWGNHYFLFRQSLLRRLIEEAKRRWRMIFSNYYSKCDDHYAYGLSRLVNRLQKQHCFDACIVNYYWFSKLFQHIDIPKKCLMAHDSFTYNNVRNNVRSLLNLKPNEEAKALQRCPYVFAMQDEEKVFFQRLSPLSKVLVSYCNYDFENQPKTGNHNIVFLSSAFHLNVNGIVWFIEEVFPLIIRRFPDCHLMIGGSLCKALPQYSDCPNIDLIGFVENAADLYLQGDISINPTYQGTGLKIKTFESIAYNKVTMVHPHSVAGIFDKDHAPLFVSDKPEEWVGFLQKVWSDYSYMDSIRECNENYIKRMNAHIRNQFEQFLR